MFFCARKPRFFFAISWVRIRLCAFICNVVLQIFRLNFNQQRLFLEISAFWRRLKTYFCNFAYIFKAKPKRVTIECVLPRFLHQRAQIPLHISNKEELVRFEVKFRNGGLPKT